jgi:hypothetical protein
MTMYDVVIFQLTISQNTKKITFVLGNSVKMDKMDVLFMSNFYVFILV